jgi:hypothetical protein
MLIGTWPVLLWPVLAGLLVNRSLLMQRFSLLHVPVACYVARGVAFDLWGWPSDWDAMTLQSMTGLGSTASTVLLGVGGWLVWIAGVSFSVWGRWHGAPRQFSLLLTLVGMWLTMGAEEWGYWELQFIPTFYAWAAALADDDDRLPPPKGWFWDLSSFGSFALEAARALGGAVTTVGAELARGVTDWIDGRTEGNAASRDLPAKGNAAPRALPGVSPRPLVELRQAPDGGTVVVPRWEVLGWPTATPARAPAAETARPVDDGSARAAGAREQAALRRAAWFDQFVSEKANRELLWSLQDQARTAHDDATRWQVAGLARLRREVEMAQRVTATEPMRPLTKNCLPALLPMIHPADLRTLERWAVRVGTAVRLGDGRTLNAVVERWPMHRIDAELPALPLPQLVDVWLRKRALLAPDRLPGDDDWSWAREAPGAATAHPTTEFTIAMDGEVAIPARLVDVSDLRWLEELYAVEGSWAARQEAGDDTAVASFDGWQTVRVAPADQRLIERHAFAIGAGVWFEDGREVNTDGERWSRERIDAELPKLPDGGRV